MCRFALKPSAAVPAQQFPSTQQNNGFINEAAFLDWINDVSAPVKPEPADNGFSSTPSNEMFSSDTDCSGMPLKNENITDFGFDSSLDLGIIDEWDLLELLKDRDAAPQQRGIVPAMNNNVAEPASFLYGNITAASEMNSMCNRQQQLCNSAYAASSDVTNVPPNLAAGMLRPPMPQSVPSLQVPETAAQLYQSLNMPRWTGYTDESNSKGSSDSEEAVERMKRKRRESAQRSRAKKNQYMKTLEIENRDLKDEVTRLRKRLMKYEVDKSDCGTVATSTVPASPCAS